MLEVNNANSLVEITTELEKLRLSCSKSANKLPDKKVKAEKLRCGIEQGESELGGIQRRIRVLKVKRDKITFTKPPPVLDRDRTAMEIGDTVEIKNQYTSFSSKFPMSRQSKIALERGAYVESYDVDKFDTVAYHQRAGHRWSFINKAHFVTDSGFDTWRISTNLSKYNGERGDINKVGSGEESFHESRSG